MAKINLAPDVRLDKLKTKRRNFIVTISAIGILVGMVVFILILQGYRWSRVYSLDVTKKKIAETKEELTKYKDIEDMVINIEQGLRAVNEIETGEPKWSKFFPELEKVTPNDIRFISFSQTGNKFTAKVEGQNVSSIARTVKSLEGYEYKVNADDKTGKKLFKNVNVDSYSTSDKSNLVEFDVTFEMEEGMLW